MLIYEMVAGYPPFYSENKVEMFKVRSETSHSGQYWIYAIAAVRL